MDSYSGRSNLNLLPISDDIPRVKEVIVDDAVFAIHCYRYAAKSDFFNALLFQNFAEKKQKKIKIHGISKDVFEKIYLMFNTGSIKPTLENACQIYIACRYLLVKDAYLRDLQAFIVDNLDRFDSLGLYEYCFANNDPILDKITAHLAPEMESLYHEEAFKTLSVGAMLNLVTDWRLTISTEDSICWVVASWMAHRWERRCYFGKILDRLAPNKFGQDMRVELTEEYWNEQALADEFYHLIFEYQPRIQKPIKSEFFKADEPLYVSNEDGLLITTHFEGTQWSLLDRPRVPIRPSAMISAAARKQSDLYVAYSDLKPWPACRMEANVLHYNFRSKKTTEIRKPLGDEIKGLYYVNDKLYSNTRNVIQQYCPEHDLWLNPIDIGLGHYQFSASDGESLYICGNYEWSGTNSVHFYDARAPEWIYWADIPHDDQGTCGTFIGDDLYMIALGQQVKQWKVLKLDMKNCKWELVTTYWARSSATPVSIRQCRNKLVVMDHYQNTHVGMNVKNGQFQFHDHYMYALKPVFCID